MALTQEQKDKIAAMARQRIKEGKQPLSPKGRELWTKLLKEAGRLQKDSKAT